jgi:hypothetical protein
LRQYVRTLGGDGWSGAGIVLRNLVVIVVRDGEAGAPAAGDAVHVVQGFSQSGSKETELRGRGLGVIEEIGGMAEKVAGHAELDGLDVVGDAGEGTGAGGVGDEVAGVAVGVGPGEEGGRVVAVAAMSGLS